MDMQTALMLLAIGSGAGVLAGIFGIGGGVIIVPALIYLMGFSPHRAVGTSLAVLLPPIGIAAFIEYYRHNNVDIPAALIIAAAAIAGGWFGSVLAHKLDGPSLRLAFGVFVVIMGITLISGALRKIGGA